MTTAPVNYWYPNKQQKARDTEAIVEVTFYIVIVLLNFCCIFATAPKQTCFFYLALADPAITVQLIT